MIPFPVSNLTGTVISIKQINDAYGYKSLVVLKDIEDRGWDNYEKGVVYTTVPVKKLKIKVGDKVCCRAFEEMGKAVIDGENLFSWEMRRNFKKVLKPKTTKEIR